MKTSFTLPLLAGCLGLGSLLTSCVDPYAQGYGSAEVTTYRPGYEVRTLPSGYRTEVVGGTSYYTHNGTYYRPRSGRYVVVEAPPHRVMRAPNRRDQNPRFDTRKEVIIREVPRGARVVDYRGSRYYQSGGSYYQRRGNGYVIVDRPY